MGSLGGVHGAASRQGALLAAVLAAALAALLFARPFELAAPSLGDPEVEAERAYAELPLAFQPNAGRGDPEVDYLTHTAAGSVYLTADGATLRMGEGRDAGAISLELAGSQPAEPDELQKLPGVVNDLRGDDPAGWETNLATYERIRYPEVYPGIDVDWHGAQGELEYDFRLAPGADPGGIAIAVRGADDVRIAPSGDLVISADGRTVRHGAPVAYQPSTGGREPVESAFEVHGARVGFDLGAYDRSRPLVIDPLVLSYSTYLGGNGTDTPNSIAVDASGAAYVAGVTASTDFNTVNAIEFDSATSDAFVAKLNPSGSTLAYSTYLGGNSSDSAAAIAVDGSGAAYVAGLTDSTDFNTVNQIETDSATSDAFVSKLTPAGSGLTYSTYLGGNDIDRASGIAVDASGAAYVTGKTSSTDFNTVGQIEGDGTLEDGFVSKLTPAGNALTYSTYLGGGSTDTPTDVDVDASGAAYVTGYTESSDFNTVNPIEGNSAVEDVFVSKLTPAGSGLAYSTYLGGDNDDRGFGIDVDSSGSAYVAGSTASSDFNTVNPIDVSGEDDGEAFVSKLNPAGSGLTYSTYLGGSGFSDIALAIAVDASGAAYVTGNTAAADFPTAGPIEGDSASTDVIVAKLTPAGTGLAYSTYLGGDGGEGGLGIALDASGAAYVAGQTASTDFNVVNHIEADTAGDDGFISKLTFDADGDGVPDDADACPGEAGPASNGGCPPSEPPPAGGGDTTPPDTTITEGPKSKEKKGNASFEFTSSEPASTFQCKLDDGAFETCTSPQDVKVKKGKHTFEVRATDAAGNTDPTPASQSWTVKKKKKKK